MPDNISVFDVIISSTWTNAANIICHQFAERLGQQLLYVSCQNGRRYMLVSVDRYCYCKRQLNIYETYKLLQTVICEQLSYIV